MSKIVELSDKLALELSADPSKERNLVTSLASIITKAYSDSMRSDEGYCFKFVLPLTQVNKFYSILGLDSQDVFNAFQSDWGVSRMKNHMYRDPYYQILVLLIYYATKHKKQKLAEDAMLVMLFKIWNGRRTRYLKYCDKKVMKYVVSNMCTNRHLFVKYDSPLALMKEYHAPKMLQSYQSQLLRDPKRISLRLIEQSWSRVNQQFVQNMRTDIDSGKKVAQGGILPLYMKAKQEGLSINSPSVGSFGDEDEPPGFDEYATTSIRDEMITSTSDFITMNPNPRYNPQFISQVNKESKVSVKVIEKILRSLHNHNYHDIIHDILSIILSRTNIQEKQDVCSSGYLLQIKKNIISSKNNPDSRKVQKLCNKILEDIFQNVLALPKTFNNYSNVQQIQLRSVVIHGLVYNLRKNICKN